ncbi:transposase [Paucibacter sp. TC2R-5]|uniref:transposase n=1 Tax=Paucibacter sp. TC2R-5 TaxID=2893555 RepID=UPI0039E1BAD0
MITRHLLGQAGLNANEAGSGAVTLIQRFGSAANLNIRLHCLVLNGVYRRSADGTPEFVEATAPTDQAAQAVLHKVITCMMKMLSRRGVLVEEAGSTYVADNDGDSDEARVLRPLHHLAGPGQRASADQRRWTGGVEVKLKTVWRDGTTHLATSPPELTQRHIDGQLCGIEFCEHYVWIGSIASTDQTEVDDGNGHTAAADDDVASGSYRVDRVYSTGQAAAIRLQLTDDFVNGSSE